MRSANGTGRGDAQGGKSYSTLDSAASGGNSSVRRSCRADLGKLMTRLLIIGGSDAGISAALRAREVDPSVNVTVVVADAFPNYSICGLPFYVSGEVPDWRRL